MCILSLWPKAHGFFRGINVEPSKLKLGLILRPFKRFILFFFFNKDLFLFFGLFYFILFFSKE